MGGGVTTTTTTTAEFIEMQEVAATASQEQEGGTTTTATTNHHTGKEGGSIGAASDEDDDATNSSGVSAAAALFASTQVATPATAGGSAPTNMASHAPIKMKLVQNNTSSSSSNASGNNNNNNLNNNRKVRKRKHRTTVITATNNLNNGQTNVSPMASANFGEMSGDDQDVDYLSPSNKRHLDPQQQQKQHHPQYQQLAVEGTADRRGSDQEESNNSHASHLVKDDKSPKTANAGRGAGSAGHETDSAAAASAKGDVDSSSSSQHMDGEHQGSASALSRDSHDGNNKNEKPKGHGDGGDDDNHDNNNDKFHKSSRDDDHHPYHNMHAHGHAHRSGGPSPPEQPDGWRVKLYRLNMDGSWDDCGTGRIVCLYRTQPARSPLHAQNNNNNNPQDQSENHDPNDDNNHTNHNNNSNKHHQRPRSIRPEPHQTTDQWLYQETGEATLCVQAELTKANRQNRVLLRTRILLRDPYQRQGDNIITWCEPFYGQQNPLPPRNNNNNNNNGNSSNENDRTNSNSNSSTTNGNSNNMQGGVDLALSFQDNAGCLDIWRQITQVQSRAAELLRSLPSDDSVQRMAAAIAAQHHAHMHQHQQQQQQHQQQQQQQQQQLQQSGGHNGSCVDEGIVPHHAHHLQQQPDLVGWTGGVGGQMMHDDGSPGGVGPDFIMESQIHLPDPPLLSNLEQIGDAIAGIHNVQQREAMANAIAKDECAYLRALLSLFPEAEERNDYGKLATLAACVKTIMLLNEPAILELVVGFAELFEQVCSCLEYDPDLREKANHRWFLRERAKFRTVVAMDNAELVAAIHRSFRVNFLRDTLLRPTMDESSLSTLSSLQTFSHADVVKGVTMSPNGEEVSLTESYLVRVIRMLGIELHALSVLEWKELDEIASGNSCIPPSSHNDLLSGKDPSTVVGDNFMGKTWKQHLAPQDSSLSSRRLRRRGCLSFLRELFNMVRLSLQQNDKDDFFSVISTLDVDLVEEFSDAVSQTSQMADAGSVASTIKSEPTAGAPSEIFNPPTPVSLLSLLGDALADPNMDASEKGLVLEIISGVAMHDPSFIRRHCIEHHAARKEKETETVSDSNSIVGRPDPNEKKQVVHIPPQHDLMAALVFLLNVTTDAGILLQATEIVRIILDTDIIGDSGSINAGFKDESDGVALAQLNGSHQDQHSHPSQANAASNDQKQFFSLFYEHYMEWLVAPFQFTLLHPIRKVPDHVLKNPSESKTMQALLSSWRSGAREDDKFLQIVPFDAIRSSFAVELLSFCVRAHLYRMKFFLLKSRVLGNVLALLRPNRSRELSGDRSLKLAALRFLRSILSVHDEFYHRHIIQHDLFAQVFAALRENPVGDNLVSSSIVEMCDYIHNENIKSLIEYIVTKHLSSDQLEEGATPLEDVSSPYVSTLTVLRKAYEANRKSNQPMQHTQAGLHAGTTSPSGSRYFSPSGSTAHHPVPRVLSGKALEDQRKFQQADEEESYFESDDSVTESPSLLSKTGTTSASAANAPLVVPIQVDEVDAVDASANTNGGEGMAELHRTQRMFSLAQAPLLSNLDDIKPPPSMDNTEHENMDVAEMSISTPMIDPMSSSDEGKKARSDIMEEELDEAESDSKEDGT